MHTPGHSKADPKDRIGAHIGIAPLSIFAVDIICYPVNPRYFCSLTAEPVEQEDV